MPPLEDPELLSRFKAILSNWYVTDYVTAKDEALEWAGKNLTGFTLKSLAKLMYEHVLAGGEIDQVRLIVVDIPHLNVPKCSNCGELVFNYGADEQILDAVKAQAAVLAP